MLCGMIEFVKTSKILNIWYTMSAQCKIILMEAYDKKVLGVYRNKKWSRYMLYITDNLRNRQIIAIKSLTRHLH